MDDDDRDRFQRGDPRNASAAARFLRGARRAAEQYREGVRRAARGEPARSVPSQAEIDDWFDRITRSL